MQKVDIALHLCLDIHNIVLSSCESSSNSKIYNQNKTVASTMTTLRQFTCDDLFRFNPINLDPLTETYGVGFYLQYLARWPEYFLVAESPGGDLMGYIMGKAEGKLIIMHYLKYA